ncbi:transcriptional regulator family: Fungal Specific TF [Trichoderma aggressivum f. europaeum]|uniref:Transcriptional regulator family: Fungal Specific TF n=1 Tax=Trichoderma aggressivum f. europaeum TaxID=173218 RepID=A0AAE1I8Z3_9HYPO|nr:transcriptional regulator family: Fungal Specific TF [Trichoderma aggressivum f. europaeum]
MDHGPKTVVVEVERRRRRPAMQGDEIKLQIINCIRSKTETCVYENHHLVEQPLAAGQSPGRSQIGVFSLASRPQAQSHLDSNPNEALAIRNHGSNVASRNTISPLASGSQDDLTLSLSASDETRPGFFGLDRSEGASGPLNQSVDAVPDSDFLANASHITGGAIHFHRDNNPSDSTNAGLIRSVTHKTRFFGQSHWINIFQTFKGMFVMNEIHLLESRSNVYPLLLKCKSLARVIKAKRTPAWPAIPTRELPERQVCDKLIDCYLKTTENIFRILHLSSFKRDYEELWEPGAHPDIAFIVHLKLILAIGVMSYDDELSMRTSAIRWVYEAMTWAAEPEFKARLGIQFIQTQILLLLAREAVGVSGDSVWVSAGDVVRRAIHMGLHRDPRHLPKRSLFANEMHRRLWNTILEMLLRMSLTSGGPPLIRLEDFDTEPPGNFDDEQLMIEGSVEKPENEYTAMSIAVALRKTFAVRLMVVGFVNDLSSCGTYEKTLELDAELRSAYKTLCRTLGGFNPQSGRPCGPSPLDLRFVDFIMQRHISALHTPYLIPALRQAKYALSRKLAVEAVLKTWSAVYPTSAIMAPQLRQNGPSLPQEDLLSRLACSGPGFYRIASLQASLLVAAELDNQLREERGLVPSPFRADLLSVIQESREWCLRSIKVGETNVKGYMVNCIIVAHIEGHMKGLDPKEIPPLFLKAAEDSVEECLAILEEKAGQSQGEAADPRDELDVGIRPQSPDWDFLVSDAMFAYNAGMSEPMTWMFSESVR